MLKTEIEQLPEVKAAARVLMIAQRSGLVEPAIASGWLRGFLTDTPPTDIDVSYVGAVHYDEAQKILARAISEVGVDPEPWDVKGIWNATIADGCRHTVDHYLRDYVCSIDTVYLAPDGKLHDPTGFGFKDAATKTLRINEHRPMDHGEGAYREVYICLEGCRRMAKLGWMPTSDAADRIKRGAALWSSLSREEKDYYLNRLRKKYSYDEYVQARSVYGQYGWSEAFDEALQNKNTAQ